MTIERLSNYNSAKLMTAIARISVSVLLTRTFLWINVINQKILVSASSCLFLKGHFVVVDNVTIYKSPSNDTSNFLSVAKRSFDSSIL